MNSKIANYHNHPGHFSSRAHGYFAAARFLQQQHKTAEVNLLSNNQFNEAIFFKPVYSYLYSFSLELLFKSIIFTNNLLSKNVTAQSWSNNHNIAILFNHVKEIIDKNSFPLENISTEFLEKISMIILWAGRYPFPKGDQKTKESIEKAFEEGFSNEFSLLDDMEIQNIEKIFNYYIGFFKILDDKWFEQMKYFYPSLQQNSQGN